MRVLITGILGQDGRILSKSLCRNGFKIVGTTRATDCARIQRLKSSLPESIELVTLDIYSFKAWTDLLSSSHFDIIYHLAAQSSVGKSLQTL